MKFAEILNYYRREEVKREISDYCIGRWVAINTMWGGRGGLFIRYWRRNGSPLHVNSIEDYDKILNRFRGLIPRTIYGSVNIYSKLSSPEDVEIESNIKSSTPIWDVDCDLKEWAKSIEAAKIILEALANEGVEKSVYLVWSGRGVHVHMHESAVSGDVLQKHHPLDIAYSIVEYILRRCEDKLIKIAKTSKSVERPLTVENNIDLKRVFTAPLSLHKSVDLAAVCFKPEEIDDFTLEWASIDNLKHNRNWRVYIRGEADELALKAIENIGGYFKRVGEIRRRVALKKVEKKHVRTLKGKRVGRFQIMALLQAARYYVLTGNLEKAKSFGLNRAIFYAWAKYHGRERRYRRTPSKPSTLKTVEEGRRIVEIGNEPVFTSPNGWFIIGNAEQLPADYDREIVKKIEKIIPYEQAWKKALNYIKSFPLKILKDQQKFFNEVYKPVRDRFLVEE
ncbi:MAG: hypothetical protein DRJ30_03285 [Candidatus Methanomethylicota archaeon]|nr:MAG: hypothetical protein DRJ30_03285 [Candidatus Verstraetearchaeota archaeon]